MKNERVGCISYIFFFFVTLLILNVIKYFETNDFSHTLTTNTLFYPLFLLVLAFALGNVCALSLMIYAFISQSRFKDVSWKYWVYFIVIGMIIAIILDIILFKTIKFDLMVSTLDLFLSGPWSRNPLLLR